MHISGRKREAGIDTDMDTLADWGSPKQGEDQMILALPTAAMRL